MADDRWEQWVEKALKGAHLRAPSSGVLRRALALGSGLAGRAANPVAWIVQVLFDSALEPATVGVRGAAGGERRLLFECKAPKGDELHQLDVRLRYVEGHLELTGQFLPPWPRAALLVQAAGVRRRAPLGPSGEFLLRALPGAARGLQVEIHSAEGATVTMPAIALDPDETR